MMGVPIIYNSIVIILVVISPSTTSSALNFNNTKNNKTFLKPDNGCFKVDIKPTKYINKSLTEVLLTSLYFYQTNQTWTGTKVMDIVRPVNSPR